MTKNVNFLLNVHTQLLQLNFDSVQTACAVIVKMSWFYATETAPDLSIRISFSLKLIKMILVVMSGAVQTVNSLLVSKSSNTILDAKPQFLTLLKQGLDINAFFKSRHFGILPPQNASDCDFKANHFSDFMIKHTQLSK